MKFVFELPDTVRPEHSIFGDRKEAVDQFLGENHLEEKNTMILSPYSNTLADLPDRFWNKVAGALKGMGRCDHAVEIQLVQCDEDLYKMVIGSMVRGKEKGKIS